MWNRILRTLVLLSGIASCMPGEAATNACSVSYSTRNASAGRFYVDVSITNSGTAPVTGWNVVWRYGTKVRLAGAPWKTKVTIDNGSVSAVDNGANPIIPPGGKIQLGMWLSYKANTMPIPQGLAATGQNCIVPEVFYVVPDSNSANWVRDHGTDWRATDIRDNIANRAAAKWFGGWTTDIGSAVGKVVGAAAALNQTPILVAYNIPGRDCGQYSAGGADSSDAYRNWIAAFAAGVGSRKAVVILEPDALAQLDCLPGDRQADRLALLRYAASQFRQLAPAARVYLDAGNSGWLQASVAASRLLQAGINDVRGFALNVSNYKTTSESTVYGNAVNAALYQQAGIAKPFVIDTSRNGNGPSANAWCDPAGRKIGTPSTEYLNGAQPEMTLWIKSPGNADGCVAPAGSFSPDLAYKLVHGYY